MKFTVSGFFNGSELYHSKRSISQIKDLANEFQSSDHVCIEGFSGNGRIAIWGVSDGSAALDVQYASCNFEREVNKSELERYLDNIDILVNNPEKMGLTRHE